MFPAAAWRPGVLGGRCAHRGGLFFALTPGRSSVEIGARMNFLSFRRMVRLGLVGLVGFVLSVTAASAQDIAEKAADFPGVQKALTPEQFAASGLSKLSPEERAKLDESLRGYFTGATQQVVQKAVAQAETRAVDRAVKQHKVEPPQLIESRIPGKVSGWSSNGTIFVLENGQHWKTTDNERRYFTPLTDPDIFIVKDIFGYKMAIAGGGTVRVVRVQ